jgi:hypothetical protein
MIVVMVDTAQLESMAARADRSLRTAAARTIAEQTWANLGGAADVLSALGRAPAWERVDEARFTCAFGERRVTITVPTPLHAPAMLRLVVRTEVNVCLGDADPALLAELHAIAQRELERLTS